MDSEPHPSEMLDPQAYARMLETYGRLVLQPGLSEPVHGADFPGTLVYDHLVGHDDVLNPDEQVGRRREITVQSGPTSTDITLQLWDQVIARHTASGDKQTQESIAQHGLVMGTMVVSGESDQGRLCVTIDLHQKPVIRFDAFDTVPGKSPQYAAALRRLADFLGLNPDYTSNDNGYFDDGDLLRFSEGIHRLGAADSSRIVL